MTSISTGIRPDRLKKLFKRLVDIYSPSGKEEEILEYLHGHLRRRRLPVIRQPLDGSRYNLVVAPAETDIQMALVGHLDTVAAHDLDRMDFEEENDRVTGLGTADMKGNCAAMVEAYLAAWELGPPRPAAALAMVVGEEEEGDGAQRLVEECHFPWAVIGEPTDLRPCLSHYGYLELQISMVGRRVHASLANRKESPIDAMLHAISALTHHMETTRSDLVYNIRDLFSSPSGFAVPDRCAAWLDIHLPPAAPVGEIVTELEELFAGQGTRHPGVTATLRVNTIDGGYELPERGALVETLKAVFSRYGLSWAPQAFRSHSDANKLWSAGMKPVILGAGQLEMAHTPDESVSFAQVCRAADLYLALLVDLRS